MFDLNSIKMRGARPGEDRVDAAPETPEQEVMHCTPSTVSARSRLSLLACVGGIALSASAGAWAESAPVHVTVTAEDIGINLLIFILSSFLGLGLIHGVAKLLHTPLMSLTNAISSVSVVAALIVLSYPENSTLVIVLATIGTALALSNVISGFMITERILKMFRKGTR